MIEHIWNDLLSDEDKAIIDAFPSDREAEFGERPMLIIIDCQPNYVGEDKPILQQLDRWPSGGGEGAWASVRRIISLRNKAREHRVPVFYTKNVQRKTLEFDSFSTKTVRDQTKYLEGNPASELLPELEVSDGEVVIPKAYPSAFYGTPLLRYVLKLRIDTIIITGNSTSGCCRQTAVDAIQMGLNVGFVEDCITDRTTPSHKLGMLDMWYKYGCLTTSDAVKHYFKSRNGVFI
jgi:nicotinamidase-related amidase